MISMVSDYCRDWLDKHVFHWLFPTEEYIAAIVQSGKLRLWTNGYVRSDRLYSFLCRAVYPLSKRRYRCILSRLERSGVIRSWEGGDGQRVYALPAKVGAREASQR